MLKFPYVFIDFDGTIADTSKGIFLCIQKALTKLNKPELSAQTLKKCIGPPLIDSFQKFACLSIKDAENAVAIFRKKYTSNLFHMNEIYKGIVPLCKKLKKTGRKVVIATSKPYEMAKLILKDKGIYELFDYVAGSNIKTTNETKADVIQHALNANNITDSSQVVMVGDRLFDIEGATQFGIKSIGITWGFGSRVELVDAGAHWIADTPEQVFKIIQSF